MGQSQSDTRILQHVDQDVAITAPYFGPILRFSHQDREKQTWNLTALIISRLSDDAKPIISASHAIIGEAELVHQYRVWKFWRVPIGFQQRRLEGRYDMNVNLANHSKKFSCVVPPIGAAPTIMYFSCNRSAKEHPPLLWQHLLSQHNGVRPFHLLLGGGDQLYCDHVLGLPSLVEWRKKPREARILPNAWTDQMKVEVETFYMNHYLRGFSELACAPFAEAIGNIPTLFQLDDHDIFDGYGSYGDEFQNCAVFQGIRAQAVKAYFLYQQHNMHNVDMWGTVGRCFLKPVGPYAILGVDCRLEHTRQHVVLPATWDTIFEKLERLPADVYHVLVMLSVPLVYGDFGKFENILMGLAPAPVGQPRKASQVVGSLLPLSQGKSPTGDPEALDDLVDQWRSQFHRAERYAVIKRLQLFAARFNKRVTILGGDVHCGGAGEIYQVSTEPYVVHKFEAKSDVTHMTQIISSAIGSAYPPRPIVRWLGRRGAKPEYLDISTRCNLVPMLPVKPGNDKPGSCLYGRRNYAQLLPQGDGSIRTELVQESRHTPRDGSVKIYAKMIAPPPGVVIATIPLEEITDTVIAPVSAPVAAIAAPVAAETAQNAAREAALVPTEAEIRKVIPAEDVIAPTEQREDIQAVEEKDTNPIEASEPVVAVGPTVDSEPHKSPEVKPETLEAAKEIVAAEGAQLLAAEAAAATFVASLFMPWPASHDQHIVEKSAVESDTPAAIGNATDDALPMQLHSPEVIHEPAIPASPAAASAASYVPRTPPPTPVVHQSSELQSPRSQLVDRPGGSPTVLNERYTDSPYSDRRDGSAVLQSDEDFEAKRRAAMALTSPAFDASDATWPFVSPTIGATPAPAEDLSNIGSNSKALTPPPSPQLPTADLQIDQAIEGLSVPTDLPESHDIVQPFTSPDVMQSDVGLLEEPPVQSPQAALHEDSSLPVHIDADDADDAAETSPALLPIEQLEQEMREVPETPSESHVNPLMESTPHSPTATLQPELQMSSPAMPATTAAFMSPELEVHDTTTASAAKPLPSVPSARKHFDVKMMPKPHLIGPRCDSGVVEAPVHGSVHDLLRKFERERK